MIELASAKKNKISLSDYNYRKDIENRLIMADFTTLDLEVLEEILYSPIKIPLRKFLKTIEAEEAQLWPVLEKFSKTGLFAIEEDAIHVDKEMRKYYESQVVKFDEDFIPGMDFLQGLLRKVPIHVLPSWYAIPRTSNNIFESLVEKYLLTPQIFQRYLSELHFSDPVLATIAADVYSSEEMKIPSKKLIQKLKLSREQFEEHMLLLEFNLVCCLGYAKTGDEWEEIVTPYHEWREYSLFLRKTQCVPIKETAKIVRKKDTDFGFIEDLASFLESLIKQPVSISHLERDFQEASKLIAKTCLLRFTEAQNHKLHLLDAGKDWLEMRLENRALFLYRHPLNRPSLPPKVCTERSLREAEKSLLRVLNSGWIYFDDFLKGMIVPLTEESVVMLKRVGKTWKYVLPEYTEEQKLLIKIVIFEWLFEIGAVSIGTFEGRDCFCVTLFGQALFGR